MEVLLLALHLYHRPLRASRHQLVPLRHRRRFRHPQIHRRGNARCTESLPCQSADSHQCWRHQGGGLARQGCCCIPGSGPLKVRGGDRSSPKARAIQGRRRPGSGSSTSRSSQEQQVRLGRGSTLTCGCAQTHRMAMGDRIVRAWKLVPLCTSSFFLVCRLAAEAHFGPPLHSFSAPGTSSPRTSWWSAYISSLTGSSSL